MSLGAILTLSVQAAISTLWTLKYYRPVYSLDNRLETVSLTACGHKTHAAILTRSTPVIAIVILLGAISITGSLDISENWPTYS
jgi:hypothetical protein